MNRLKPADSLFFNDFDIQKTHNDRVEDEIGSDFEQKVSADQTENHVLCGAFKTCCRAPFGNGFHKEQEATQKENAGVHNRTNDRCRKYRDKAISFFKKIVNHACCETAKSAFQNNGDNRADHVNREKQSRVAADENCHAKHESEPCADQCAAFSCADDYRQKYKRY